MFIENRRLAQGAIRFYKPGNFLCHKIGNEYLQGFPVAGNKEEINISGTYEGEMNKDFLAKIFTFVIPQIRTPVTFALNASTKWHRS